MQIKMAVQSDASQRSDNSHDDNDKRGSYGSSTKSSSISNSCVGDIDDTSLSSERNFNETEVKVVLTNYISDTQYRSHTLSQNEAQADSTKNGIKEEKSNKSSIAYVMKLTCLSSLLLLVVAKVTIACTVLAKLSSENLEYLRNVQMFDRSSNEAFISNNQMTRELGTNTDTTNIIPVFYNFQGLESDFIPIVLSVCYHLKVHFLFVS